MPRRDTPQAPCFMPNARLKKWGRRALVQLLVTLGSSVSSVAIADDLAEVQRLYYSGQAIAAMERADSSLARVPKDPQMRFIKSVMLSDAKQDSEAIALLQQLIDDYPDLAEPYNNLAALYAASGDYAKARALLDQAIRTNPAYAVAHENLGDVYAALAAKSYARALKLDSFSATLPPKLEAIRDLSKSRFTSATTTRAPAMPAPLPEKTIK